MISFTPLRLYAQERAPVTHWRGGWVGIRAGVHGVEKRKISWLCRESNPDSFAVQQCRLLRRIFGPKGVEVIGGWRKLRSEEREELLVGSRQILGWPD
jgi:hypothetical protein